MLEVNGSNSRNWKTTCLGQAGLYDPLGNSKAVLEQVARTDVHKNRLGHSTQIRRPGRHI